MLYSGSGTDEIEFPSNDSAIPRKYHEEKAKNYRKESIEMMMDFNPKKEIKENTSQHFSWKAKPPAGFKDLSYENCKFE